MAKAKFCLVIDTEADFWKYIPSPHFKKIDFWKWKFNKIISRYKFAKGRKGIQNIVRLLKEYRFPATFTITGHLYLKECKGYPHFNEFPEARWFKRLLGKRWDYWDPESSYREYPGLYLGDFIEKEMKVPYFDLGLHGFSHEALTLENKEIIDTCVKSAVKSANSIGIKPVSFGAPFNMIEDVNEPKKVYSCLKKNGIKIVRYAGNEDDLKQMHNVAIKKSFKKYGLKAIHVSHYFEGNSSTKLMRKILKEIKENLDKDVVYCLCTHDFTHKNTRNLGIIIRFLSKLEKENKIKILNMGDLVK